MSDLLIDLIDPVEHAPLFRGNLPWYSISVVDADESSLIISNRSKVVPVFCMIGTKVRDDSKISRSGIYHPGSSLRTYAPNSEVYDDLPKSFSRINNKILDELYSESSVSRHYQSLTTKVDKLGGEEGIAKLVLYKLRRKKEELLDWIEDDTLEIDSVPDNLNGGRWGFLWKWNSLLRHFFYGNGFTSFRTRGARSGLFIIGPYYLSHISYEGTVTPLVCLTTEKKYFPYLKTSMLTEDLINSNVLKLYVKEDLDIKESCFPILRPYYRKWIKSFFENAGVEIILKRDMNDLFAHYTLPKFNTIQEYETFLQNGSKAVLESIREENNQ